MTRAKLGLLLCCLALAGAPNAPARAVEQPSIQAYGQINLSCQEWTDGCVVCTKNKEAPPSCSTPGIACQPKEIICRAPVAPATPR
jgi:hypothetical protein